jgi:hypothetical protein
MTGDVKRRVGKPSGSRIVIFVPEKEVSQTILDFAAPLLEPLGPLPRRTRHGV